MKKLAIVVAAIALIGTPAFAADMAVKAPPPAVAPPAVYNWGGFYIGGNVGYGWGVRSDPETSFNDGSGIGIGPYAAAGGFQFPNVQPTGVIGGGQIGYNWMFSPNWGLRCSG